MGEPAGSPDARRGGPPRTSPSRHACGVHAVPAMIHVMAAPLADPTSIRAFMRGLRREADVASRIYLTGGASAVLLGWRPSTIDIDLTMQPEHDALYRAIARLKDELQVNVELAAPSHFVPALPGWEERSLFIASEGRLQFFHYDFHSQALAKIERDHEQDRTDVVEMIARGLVDPARLRELYARVADQVVRYPAIDAAGLGLALDRLAGLPG